MPRSADSGRPGPTPPSRTTAQLLKFALVGGSNTAVTLLAFVFLQHWVSATVAYTVVFTIGLAYTTTMTARVVFGSRLRWRTAAAFITGYVCVYVVGLGVVRILEAAWDPGPLVVSVLVVVATAPLNFLVGRRVFGAGIQDAAQSATVGTPPTGWAKPEDPIANSATAHATPAATAASARRGSR